MTLYDFIKESNMIEGIHRNPTQDEVEAHEKIMKLDCLLIEDIEKFVRIVANVLIRDKAGMNVYIGNHIPISGGPLVRTELNHLLEKISDIDIDSYFAHIQYEKLHPFMDGNGRSGRIIWAWHRQREGFNPFQLGFLHQYYYQTLENSR